MSTIAWLVPSLLEGSGGHRTVLQNAEFLSRNGFKTTLYLERRRRSDVGETPAQTMERLYGYRFDDVRIGWDDIEPVDLAVATIWTSADVVARLPSAVHKLYFVQDWEPMFYPMGDDALRAERSYRRGLLPITIGRWLQVQLQRHGSRPGGYFDFCADLDVYRPMPDVLREDAIAFICQPDKPRRAALLGLDALAIVKALRPQTRVYLYGSDETVPGSEAFDQLGMIGLTACNALYNRCQVGLCLSTSNPSRIPFEMMAAGLPVVELHRENTVHDLPPGACRLTEPDPAAIAEALLQILEQPEAQARAREAAQRHMRTRDLACGMQQLLDAVRAAARGDIPSAPQKAPIYDALPIAASERTRAVMASAEWQRASRWRRRHRKKRSKIGRRLAALRRAIGTIFGRARREGSDPR